MPKYVARDEDGRYLAEGGFFLNDPAQALIFPSPGECQRYQQEHLPPSQAARCTTYELADDGTLKPA